MSNRCRRFFGAAWKWGRWFLLFSLIIGSIGAWRLWLWWTVVEAEMTQIVEAHRTYEIAHPGWSFPAHVWSAPASLDLPPERLAIHAAARGYENVCPPVSAGQYCDKPFAVIPRAMQRPPGTPGASEALEPVLIGLLIGEDGEIRVHLPLDDAPPHLLAAILASEDQEFHQHIGVNPVAAVRAAWANFQKGGYSQGASTLSMQVVRTLTQRRERTLERKAWEAMAAVALDRHLGKDQVLQMYLDAPYLGQQGSFSICGFQAAAQHYWGVDAKDLSLSQAATLAAILPAPGRYAPDRHPEIARTRRDRVLAAMAEAGWDVTEALTEPVVAKPHPLPTERYPAYFQATRSFLEQELPAETLYGAGLHVHTALDLAAQEQTDRLIPERLKFLTRMVGRRGAPLQAAGALIDPPTGTLVAIYGGDMEVSTDFNRATQAWRQPGSSFKPVVYALAFSELGEDGKPKLTASHAVPNAPRLFKGAGNWRPRNISGEYSATASLAWAMAMSQNIATASLLEEVGGPEALIPFAASLGFDTSKYPVEMGLSLGQAEVTPMEMARYVSTIANGGLKVSGSPVVHAMDAGGRVRWQLKRPDERVLTPESAALTRELMRRAVMVGTGGGARGQAGFAGYRGPLAGKTGTTDNDHDVWFVGATAHYAASIWMGYDQPMRIGASASDIAAPMWGWWMHAVHIGLPQDREFSGPEVEYRAICGQTGRYANATCRAVGAAFLPGTKPPGGCGIEHPPPDKEKKYISLWKRIEQRKAEEEAAALAGQEGEFPDDSLPPSPTPPSPEESAP